MFLSFLLYQSNPVTVICTSMDTLQAERQILPNSCYDQELRAF